MNDDDVLIVGGVLVLAYLLWPKGSTSTTTIIQGAPPASSGASCDSCGGATPPAPGTSPQPNPVQASFCTGGQILRAGVCINPASDAPRLGSANNDAILAEITRQLEASNAAGNWALSWEIAARRDAWIKQQGY